MICNALHKLRLILAGILIGAGVGALAQVGGGSGISARPFDDSNVAKLDVANTFSGTQTFSGIFAELLLHDSDAATDEKYVRVLSTAGLFVVDSLTDGAVNGPNLILADRTGTTWDSLNLTATSVQANGVDVATTTSGSFSLTFPTACTTTPSMTVDWVQIAGIVTWSVDVVLCTGDSTSFTSGATDVPAAIRPAANRVVLVRAEDAASPVLACMGIFTTGQVNLSIASSDGSGDCNTTGTWTASSTRAINRTTVSYAL